MAEKKPPPGTSDLDSAGWIGHLIPAAFGFGALIAAFFSHRAGIQATLAVALVVCGGLLLALAYFSALARSRAAWSFLISLSIVLGIMTLFGAPKIRDLVGIHLSVALGIPILLGIAAGLLSAISHRYKSEPFVNERRR